MKMDARKNVFDYLSFGPLNPGQAEDVATLLFDGKDLFDLFKSLLTHEITEKEFLSAVSIMSENEFVRLEPTEIYERQLKQFD